MRAHRHTHTHTHGLPVLNLSQTVMAKDVAEPASNKSESSTINFVYFGAMGCGREYLPS